jgi:hypothetical protein
MPSYSITDTCGIHGTRKNWLRQKTHGLVRFWFLLSSTRRRQATQPLPVGAQGSLQRTQLLEFITAECLFFATIILLDSIMRAQVRHFSLTRPKDTSGARGTVPVARQGEAKGSWRPPCFCAPIFCICNHIVEACIISIIAHSPCTGR